MSQRSAIIDLRDLRRDVPGRRSSVWLGMLWFLVIEGTVIASMLTSYFYYRVMAREGWPPPGIEAPTLVKPALALVLLVVSLAAASWSHRLHRNHRLLGFRVSLLGALVVLAGYSILSAFELATLPYTASAHVYGSLVWTLSGYQLFHVLGLGCLAFGVFLVDVFARSSSRPGDAALSVLLLYWKFVVIAALPSYATLYLVPHLQG